MAVRLEGRDITDHQTMIGIFSRGIKVFCIMTVNAVTKILMLKCTQQFMKSQFYYMINTKHFQEI